MSQKEALSRSSAISDPIKDPLATATSGSGRRFKIHMSLQHKGGSTKSFTANIIAQFYKNRSRPAVVLDADPACAAERK